MASLLREAICVTINFMTRRFSLHSMFHSRRFSVLIMAAGLLLILSAYGPRQTDRGVAQPSMSPLPTPTSVRDPTPTPPTQGGHGRDVFYIYCMSCHGDRGQGLTDEFRNRVYPPEDTNCWKSGCHGDTPYANGFRLPKTVPALIGADTLQHFATAQAMYDFMRHAMPFNKPGSLSDEQYLQILAFLLESNQLVPAGTRLDASMLSSIVIQRSTSATTTVQAPTSATHATPSADAAPVIIVAGAIMLLVLSAVGWAVRRRTPRSG